PPEVEVVTVERRNVPVTVELPARAQAIRSAEVRARVEGVLEKRLFVEGTDVQEGTPLFLIDPRTLEAEIAAAKAALAKAQADALAARLTAERYKALVGKAVSKQDYDLAEARRKQAEAEVAAAEAALRRAEIDLEYAHITAPIAGRIGRALVTEGALVGKGEATHLATIEQLDPILVNFTQSSSEYLRYMESLRAGKAKAADAPIRLITEDRREYPHPGKLLVTESTIDPATGSVAMRAEFPNPDRMLLPGQFVRVRLPLAEAADVVTVPQRAVQASPQGQMVLLVDAENKVVPQPVRTGGLSGTDWIITEGLTGGERIIVNGVQKVQPGAPVTPVPLAAQAAPVSTAAVAPAAHEGGDR
ncbi:MAG: efflux RND transporter periplasmic adaptor subunit, partial [Gammaproteobacteria bacterium]